MLRKFLAALAVLFLCGTTAAQATIVGPLPYTLTNGSTADAAQVMANFNKIVNDVNTNVIFPSFSQQNYYAADSGAANAMVVTLSPAPTLYVAGIVVNVKVAVTNTGATTINANGLGSQNVVNLDGSALKSQQLLAGMVAQLVYDGSQFQLTSLSPLAVRQAALSRTTAVFTTAGAWTFTVPVGVYSAKIEQWGGGGGGGGGANGASDAGGGGGGAYGITNLSVVPGDILSGVVGAGGAAGTAAGSNGGAGATTTLLQNGVGKCSTGGGAAGLGIAGAGTAGQASGGGAVLTTACLVLTGGGGTSGLSGTSGGIGGVAPRGGVGGAQNSGGGGNPGGGGGGAGGIAAGGGGGVGWVYIEY